MAGKKNFTKFNFIFLIFLKKLDKMYSTKYAVDILNLKNFDDYFYFLELNKKLLTLKNKFNIDQNYIKKSKNDFSNFLDKNYNINTLVYVKNYLNPSITKLYLTELYYNFTNLTLSVFKFSKKSNFNSNFSESSTNKYIDLTNGLNLTRSNYTFFF